VTEVWAGIPSAPGYCVSNTGRVRGPRGDLSTPATKRGYSTCSLRAGGKKITTTVQRLVLEAFVGPPPTPAHEANHKNGKKQDNRPINLEWVTRQENVDHAWATGLHKRKPPKVKSDHRKEHAGDHWQTVTIQVYVPTHGRCDQHAVVIDGEQVGLLSATQIGVELRKRIKPRPSQSLLGDWRRAS
jgi:hypothetical protein